MKNTTEKPLPEVSEDPKISSSRSRIRQDKFSSTLHLACFMPQDEKPKK